MVAVPSHSKLLLVHLSVLLLGYVPPRRLP
jgi:hypothetical protein